MKLKYILAAVFLTAALSSCTKVKVTVSTQLTTDVYPNDSASYVTASGPVYVALRGNYGGVEYFFQASLSTDESIMPARGGNWFDGGQNQNMHYHTFDVSNNYTTSNWTWMSTIIGTANQTLSILGAKEPSSAYKSQNLAEIKMIRALAYFWMMDNYGSVPIDTVYGDFTPHANVTRTVTFNFIESEIKAALPYLSSTVGASTYGRATKYMAYALLAKMYLNAEYYTGTARYNDCIAACDNIINAGVYSLQPRASYMAMFSPTNGPAIPEFIFAIPYDASFDNGTFPFRGVDNHSRYDVPRSMGKVATGGGFNFFNLPFTPAGSRSTIPSYYAYFYDANDIRNKQWLTGLQYQADGVTPITVTTTYASYDAITYAGNNNPYTYQVNLTPNIYLRQSVTAFDAGNDEVAWNMGYRNVKFYPDATSSSRNQNNDIPVFRYADILLMKSEAILRGGTATGGATALSLANTLRASRTTAAPWTNITLDSVYNERTRELSWEAWHRNDMIRFGKFEGSWGFKTDANIAHRIFPIPTAAMKLNPALVQNPGY